MPFFFIMADVRGSTFFVGAGEGFGVILGFVGAGVGFRVIFGLVGAGVGSDVGTEVGLAVIMTTTVFFIAAFPFFFFIRLPAAVPPLPSLGALVDLGPFVDLGPLTDLGPFVDLGPLTDFGPLELLADLIVLDPFKTRTVDRKRRCSALAPC